MGTYQNEELFNRISPKVDIVNTDVNNLLHGMAKEMMYELELEMDGLDIHDYVYLQGKSFVWSQIYQLTYDIAFAKGEAK